MLARITRSCSLLVLWALVQVCCVVANASTTPSSSSAPQVLTGRSTAGTWRGVPFELIYYVTLTEETGPYRKKSCFEQSVEAAFSKPSPPLILTLTPEQQERVLVDAAKVAEMKYAEETDREFRKDERKRQEEDGHIHYGPIPRISDQYHAGAFWYSSSEESARASLIYNFDVTLAVYLNGTFIDTHETDKTVLAVSPIPDEFVAFIQETVAPLIAASSATAYLDAQKIQNTTNTCIADLGTDIWDLEQDQAFLQDTTIIGMKASGVWQQKDDKNNSGTGTGETSSYSYEIVSFLEFFRMTSTLTESITTCFYDSVYSQFFVPDEFLEDGTWISSRLPPDQLNALRQLSTEEEASHGIDDDDSIFWKFSLGTISSAAFAVQHGAAITLDGKIIKSRSELPHGFELFVESMMDEMLASPFDMRDSMDEIYEQDTIRDSNDLLIFLYGLIDACQHPSN